MSETPSGQPPPIVPTDTAAPFGFTFGNSHVQSAWSDFRRLTWPQLVEMLTSHVPGPKEGSCIVPAQFSGARRHKDDASRIDVAFLDSDAGMTLDEIEAAVIRNGWEAVISSTHSHMSTRTRVALRNWDRFFENHPNATPEDFLIDDKGYTRRVAQGAECVETTAEFVYIEHQPCPKFRVAIPLERPWLAANYNSQQEANAAWKERIEALAAALGLAHDQACTDTSRLFYLPRKPPNGVVPETAVVSGAHCDIFALAAPIDADLFTEAQPKQHKSERFCQTEYLDPISGECIDLVEWAKAHGSRFLIAKALRKNKPGVLTGHSPEGKVHIDCPNASQHTDPARDGATYVVNGGNGTTKGFVIHCRHAHCTDKDRLFFVRKMLDEGWLKTEDLTDPVMLGDQQQKNTDDVGEPCLPCIYYDDIKANIDANDFVEGLLLSSSMTVVYGQSNSGKTFLMSDLALHVAASKKWRDKEIDGGAVLWLAMEGAFGISNRIVGWKKEHGITATLPFVVVPVTLNLLDPDADTSRLIQTIKALKAKLGVAVVLTVVDTLSRAMAGGNENAPDDMGALVTNGTAIQQVTKSALAWIHHSGKDEARGARGHSLLRAATDTEIEIVAEGASRLAAVRKQRELPCEGEFAFSLKVVELGTNRRGKPVTTCVVVHSGQASGDASGIRTRLRGHTKRALEVLQDLVAEQGKPGGDGVPAGYLSVPEKWWRDRFHERAMAGSEYDAKQKGFKRAATELINQHLVGLSKARVWIVRGSGQTGHAPYNDTSFSNFVNREAMSDE